MGLAWGVNRFSKFVLYAITHRLLAHSQTMYLQCNLVSELVCML